MINMSLSKHFSNLFRILVYNGILISVLSPVIVAQTQNIRFKHLSSENGLSQNTILCMSQDSKGFMWVGTYDGLNRYDGYEFKVFKSETGNPYSLANNTVQYIFEDHDGVLWIATDGGLDRYDQEKECFIHYKYDANDSNSLSNNKIRWICEDLFGVLWIGTYGGGLNKFEKERKRFIRYKNNPNDPNSISSNLISCVYIDRSGNPWIATDAGINRFDRERNLFIRYQHDTKNPYSLNGNDVYRIYEDHSGVFWIGIWNRGLDRFDLEKRQFIHYRNNPSDPYSLSSDVVRSIYEDRMGRLWVGTWGGGLDQYDRNNNRFIHHQNNPNDPNSLSNNSVISIYEDRSGTIWIGNDYGGINELDAGRKKFLHYKKVPNSTNTLSSNTVYSVIETVDKGKKVLWIGTQANGLNKFDRSKNQFTHYKYDPNNPHSLSDNNARVIFEDRTGSLWIGTNQGLNLFDRAKETFTQYIFDSNTPNRNNIFSICEDKFGYLWVGTYGGGLYKFDPKEKKFTSYAANPENPNSLSENFIWSIFEDRNGVLWIGTENGGLNQLDREKNQFIHYKADPDNPNSLSSNKILCIHEDRSGILWLGTTGGLNRFDRINKRFTHYMETDGLPSNAIQSILEDKHGNLWLGTQKGLSRFNPYTNMYKNFKVSDGLQGNEFCVKACFISKDGEMFFGGINGFNAFYPDSIKDDLYIPSIVITDFQIFNNSVSVGKEINGHLILQKSITETKEISISYKESVFSFEFASLNLISPEENRYAYMMEGFDKEWNYTNASRRFATYTNMSGGDYIFRVKGSNSDGVWNEAGASIRVNITPPFWKTWSFYAICVIVLISAIVGTYRYKLYRVRVNEKNLQKKVNERTLELAHEVDEHQKAEEALQRERNLLRTVIDNIPDGIYTKDLEGRKTLANHADVYNMGRKSEAEVLGKNDYELFPKDMADGFTADDRSVIQTGKPVINREEYVIDGEGKKHFLVTSKLPFRDERNQIIGLIGIGRDITERKIAEGERERLIKSLQEAMADIKVLSGLVPICSNCKKIRDDKGFWMQLEAYIQKHSNAEFTHGMCPDCIKKMYPDFIFNENK